MSKNRNVGQAELERACWDVLNEYPEEFVDYATDEVNSTSLAEWVADDYGRHDWLDDETSDIWDAAWFAASRYEKERLA